MKQYLSLATGAMFSYLWVTPSDTIQWWIIAEVCIGLVGYIKWQS